MSKPEFGEVDTLWANDYLQELDTALVRRRVWDRSIAEEIHAHLLDSAEGAVREGLSATAAQARALERMGSPQEVAQAALVAQRVRITPRAFRVALIIGIVLALIDILPMTGKTVFLVASITISATVLSALIPGKAWLWTITIGGFLPFANLMVTGRYGGFLALAMAAFGALVGLGTQRLLRPD